MQKVVDHLGRTVNIPNSPKRIISLSPAFTATLFELSLEKEVIGRTRFCNTPESIVKTVKNVGGTKEIEMDRIRALKPDLIIAEKEENTKEMVMEIEKEFPVFVFEVQSIEEGFRMIEDLGKITNRKKEAQEMSKQVRELFQHLPNLHSKRVAYVIWQNPYMVVGNNTYIQSVLASMKLVNPFVDFEGRYPAVTLEDLQHAQLDYLFLATEPYPFREKHIGAFSEMLPNTKVIIVDGEMFWYGSNMVSGAKYLQKVFK